MMSNERQIQIAAFLLRVASGVIFLQNGGFKLFGWFGGMHGTLPPLMMVAGILEFFGGLAMILGLLTRPIAFILSGEMAVAYFMGHAAQGNALVPLLNKGQPAALLCFVFLFFAAYGAGQWSIDGWRKAK